MNITSLVKLGPVAFVSIAVGLSFMPYSDASSAEAIQACIISSQAPLTAFLRTQIASCLGWRVAADSVCDGSYLPDVFPNIPEGEIRIYADSVSFYQQGNSSLKGHVQVLENQRLVTAPTAYILRDAHTHKITQIELVGGVRYQEADKQMLASKAILQPEAKTGQITDVLYRLNAKRRAASLPAWGRAAYVERFANEDYLLQKTTYSTCAPEDRAWQIEAHDITLHKAEEVGYAKHALLRVGGVPVLYSPILTFPYTEKRKSGFLMPVYGYSNVGGYDLALPYYWNIAPNYDTTIIPHLYTRRGLMMGADTRFLTEHSNGSIAAHFLPHDKAYGQFLATNTLLYPELRGDTSNRWSLLMREHTQFNPNWQMNLNYRQVSDNYYLQDFSNNLAILTERQLLRQGDVAYTGEHWTLRGMVQGYQTLHPINEVPIEDAYQRLPQLFAQGHYQELPFSSNLDLLGQLDVFQWPGSMVLKPQGPRLHFNPVLSTTQMKPWGYVTPSVEFVENHYDLSYRSQQGSNDYNRFIPRYALDSGLYLERSWAFSQSSFTQTLEPRAFYLNVPYQNQTQIPVFDSGNMIFTSDQLFRKNRFSGYDRIGDANQVAYAITSRWLDGATGRERANFTVGQIKYFSQRRVTLCQSAGTCLDSPLTLGYLSPQENLSPVASHAGYYLSPTWILSGDYVWNPATRATNNGDLNLHYQSGYNQLIHLGYTYLQDGDITSVAFNRPQNNALHQATFAYAWPFSQKWSTLGAYQYNISKGYSMTSLLGMQYDSCCWAMRLMGGRAFQSLTSTSSPRYNNSVYLQILLKGLGAVGNTDPNSTVRSFVPGYQDMFHL